jgi:beta-mannosidase
VDLRPFVKHSGNLLQIWFQLAPRWLGEFGYTSEITEWKTRFGYYWDWTSRMVQTGVWDSLTLETFEAGEIRLATCESDVDLASGSKSLRLQVETDGGARVHAMLKDGDRLLHEETTAVQGGGANLSWQALPVDLWWPNGMGSQPLYELTVELLNEAGQLLDVKKLRTGFRHVEWVHTDGAAPEAYPYLCRVNGKAVFLFGVNWTPIRPNFADLKEPEYSKRIKLYRELGMNILRVWGGACREREWFYDLCDELGLLVWQEFPLCSSGIDNCPPDDPKSIEDQAAIAKGYIERLRHHTSLILWGGGNELEDNRAGSQSKNPTLTIANHPMVKRLGEVVKQNDPGRAYVPTAPFGPVGTFTMDSVGQRAHWDVHGPYDPDGPVTGEWATLWKHDDAMFHSEVGCPGASSVDIIERYSGNLHPMPATHNNPLWNRQPWWVDWSKFIDEKGHEPSSLAEYVEWSQKRQADALAIALVTAQSRFPACGGIIFWMGHDAFPCTANLSIVDFDGNPKPAATRLRDVLRRRT